MFVRGELEKIERKILNDKRLSREDGEKLFACNELTWLGALADYVRKKICGDLVYYNVNCHVNLTNICLSRCKFCAFGRNADDRGSYAMTMRLNLSTRRAKIQIYRACISSAVYTPRGLLKIIWRSSKFCTKNFRGFISKVLPALKFSISQISLA